MAGSEHVGTFHRLISISTPRLPDEMITLPQLLALQLQYLADTDTEWHGAVDVPPSHQQDSLVPQLSIAVAMSPGVAGTGGSSNGASTAGSLSTQNASSSTSSLDAEAPPSPTEVAGVTGRRPGKRPAARGTAFYPRKRANTACQVCRARKTKCDNMKPSCTYCLSVGATCIQSPVDLSSFDPASLKILDRLDELERVIRSVSSNPASESPASSTHLGPLFASPTADASGRGFGNSGGVDKSSISQQRQLSLPTIHETITAGAYRSGGVSARPGVFEDGPEINSILPQRVDHILQWSIFLDTQSHHLSPASYRAPPDAMSTPPASAASLAALCDMESPRIYELLNNFFHHIHCKNPILDEASARRTVLDAFLNGIDWSPASCLALIICALGCIATPFGPSTETKVGTQAYNDSQIFFHAAQKRIGPLLVRSDIVGAQCLFLSGIYLMMVFQPIYAWRFFSQALAACQHFPFLARAQNLQSSPDSMEMGRQDTQEQAVYWSAWKSERELRQELDLPDFDILNSGSTLYPPFFPAPPSQPANSPEGPDSEAQRARASWLFYLAEISLRRLTSRLSSEILSLRERYPSNSKFLDVLSDMMPEYEAQVREWSDSLPADLSINSPVEEDAAKAGCAMPSTWDESIYEVITMLAYWEDEDQTLNHWRAILERELTIARMS
ncbi:hypothetical protein PT974_05974 [Cladobotryum mycophilum]|uniref:Zn(2)-C6 fungal-type domain-containing protein n=1 Tax=Cladobotryum mycophilum TaxID=491253 RepID=A0ABR0SK91_9HYPO